MKKKLAELVLGEAKKVSTMKRKKVKLGRIQEMVDETLQKGVQPWVIKTKAKIRQQNPVRRGGRMPCGTRLKGWLRTA